MYKLIRNNKIVQHVVMTGELGYMIYKTPVVTNLVFDSRDKALEVAKLLNAEVAEEFAKVA